MANPNPQANNGLGNRNPSEPALPDSKTAGSGKGLTNSTRSGESDLPLEEGTGWSRETKIGAVLVVLLLVGISYVVYTKVLDRMQKQVADDETGSSNEETDDQNPGEEDEDTDEGSLSDEDEEFPRRRKTPARVVSNEEQDEEEDVVFEKERKFKPAIAEVESENPFEDENETVSGTEDTESEEGSLTRGTDKDESAFDQEDEDYRPGARSKIPADHPSREEPEEIFGDEESVAEKGTSSSQDDEMEETVREFSDEEETGSEISSDQDEESIEPSKSRLATRARSTPLETSEISEDEASTEEETEQYEPARTFEEEPRAAPVGGVYIVSPHDNFWSISKKIYGSGRFYRALAKHNEVVVGSPRNMKPGLKIKTPSRAVLEDKYPELIPALAVPVRGKRTTSETKKIGPPGFFSDNKGELRYRVGENDTLTGLSQKFLGKSSRWTDIYELNRDIMTDADSLSLGMELRMPTDTRTASREQADLD